MITLAVESSAGPVSVAVCKDGQVLAEYFVHTKQTHSETLMPMVESVMHMAGCTVKDIDLLAVAAGPGSFTGVRIGVATVKGIAFANDVPCCAVSTLEAIAFPARKMEGHIISAVMDARCQQVYNANFAVKDGKLVRLCKDRALAIDELWQECKKYDEKIWLCGDGAEVCAPIFAQDKVVLSSADLRFQHAVSVALLAEQMYKEKKAVSGASLAPFYLRLPQAERELKKKKGCSES